MKPTFPIDFGMFSEPVVTDRNGADDEETEILGEVRNGRKARYEPVNRYDDAIR
jgi:hypothetical protein